MRQRARTFAHRTLTSKHTRTQTYRQTDTHTHTHTSARADTHLAVDAVKTILVRAAPYGEAPDRRPCRSRFAALRALGPAPVSDSRTGRHASNAAVAGAQIVGKKGGVSLGRGGGTWTTAGPWRWCWRYSGSRRLRSRRARRSHDAARECLAPSGIGDATHSSGALLHTCRRSPRRAGAAPPGLPTWHKDAVEKEKKRKRKCNGSTSTVDVKRGDLGLYTVKKCVKVLSPKQPVGQGSGFTAPPWRRTC